ncbi:ABC transporter permease [Mucilaginibacter sp. OK098]|uniref:ABC transporter permease n=1 Tax=Mucilaginibacter sp. OK098 TaxID=1855297 RepID=UPI0009187DC5|nr:ABC transporter permease [Mucilaginibacter sp. OK098]SHM54159.1 ABC-type antimicrobial peptide transport system, permease component [Mucilaginibacter sp. OK098]
MLKNYLKIAWRNLWKHKTFSFINILGLSAGITFTLLIGTYIWGTLQVNQELKDIDNQYVILSKWKDPNMGNEASGIPELSKTLKVNYPGLVANYYNAAVAITNVSKGDKHFREGILVGDSTLLSMYGFKLLGGDVKTALQGTFSVVITSKMAIKYFGKTDVVGQTLNFQDFAGGNHDYIITGVLKGLPANTITGLSGNDKFQFFINGNLNKSLRTIEGWDNTGTVDHIELKNGADPKAVENAMLDLLRKNETDDEIKNNLKPYLAPLKDYYLQANNGLVKKMTWTLSCIAFFILLMAVINFVNICIGRSSGRMKEMGIRKVMGGLRNQLISQFLTESVIMVLLATLLALFIYPYAGKYFSAAMGYEVTGLLLFPAYFILIPLLFVFFVGLLAGIYPALVLSALGTIDSLKGKLHSVRESVWLRKTLVAFQFVTAAIVFIGAIIISQQVDLFFKGNLGYNKDYVIYAQVPRDWSPKGVKKMEAIRYRLAQMPQVRNISLSWEIPGGMDWQMRKTLVSRQGANPIQGFNTQHLIADNQYAATFNIPLKAGNFFSPVERPDDSTEAVINQTELKALGWNTPDEAIGQKIVFQGSSFTICGVTADFHFGSMQQRIQPITFTNVNDVNIYRYLSIKLKPGNMQGNIEALQKKWSEVMPGAPFEYSFMDDALKKLYATEIQLKEAAYIATALAFVIVLLGVLGLISLSIQKRTREIGIRKVLGSSVAGITALFLKDFLSVILLAGIIACPLAYVIMHQWLSDYAYRINISLTPFIISIGLLTIITAIIIVLQTIRAAFVNPVKSLKSE